MLLFFKHIFISLPLLLEVIISNVSRFLRKLIVLDQNTTGVHIYMRYILSVTDKYICRYAFKYYT